MDAIHRRDLGAFAAALAAFALHPAPAGADQPKGPESGAKVTVLFEHALPNVPGKSMTAVAVDYAPGAASPPHRHADSASILAYVASGAIRSAVGTESPRVYRTGETWFEPPGSRHPVSGNASTTEPARLIAFVVADTGAVLTGPDR
jgi:quercetin dioxygenase-like cupin family protein